MEINTQGSVEALVLNTRAIKSHSDSKFGKTIFWAFPLCWKSTEDCGLCLFILWSSQLHYWNWKHGWMKEHTNEWMNNWMNEQIKSIWCSLGNPWYRVVERQIFVVKFWRERPDVLKRMNMKIEMFGDSFRGNSYHCLGKWTPYFADV